MPVDRPTFSESWYRVADLRPRLRATVQVYRQHFRGQVWHVLEDPSNNQFFRLNEAAYQFVGMLDGRRTVGEVWRACNEILGDGAPTQGEAIQLLGQLYTSNLLQAELPPDAEGLFRRYRRRVTREVQGYLMNLLFIRIPLLDPDRFLDRWVGVMGKVFSWYGLVLWACLIAAGLYFAIGNWSALTDQTESIFNRQKLAGNLPLLYLSVIVMKVFHEFGHAFACKHFGRLSGSGGQVHVMGVMFLVFTPMPYVDASSSWAFQKKWHRAVVCAAGMYVELALAAVAAVVWANTSAGDVRAVCYHVMFVASVSTLLFNGNPLLRYDAYYILSDVLEIPNLAHRAKQFLYHLVRRYVWSVRQARTPAHNWGERVWFVLYGLASTVYRVFISVAILLFIADKLFFVGAALAVAALVAWVLVPLGKFAHYLAASPELIRVRGRAVATVLLTLAAIAAGVGVVPAPDRFRIEGVVEPVNLALVFAKVDGFLEDFAPSGQAVARDEVVVRTANPHIAAELRQTEADLAVAAVRKKIAKDNREEGVVQALERHMAALRDHVDWLRCQQAALTIAAPMSGEWYAPKVDYQKGAYISRGDAVGLVASPEQVFIRAVAGQEVAPMLIAQQKADPEVRNVEIRLKGRPEDVFPGRIEKVMEAGKMDLPSKALAYSAGGTIQTSPSDQKGLKAAERFFEVHIAPEVQAGPTLRTGQRVVVRASLQAQPLAFQWWRSILQLVQKRFQRT